ncbi:PpsA5: phosphoenolpyruvate synthase/pyruvate phosphate dikinase (PEP synthase) [Desulfosarcina variabilis str. Montpellier]|uniref:PEP/pyruvate-binding domain-containing protein n=1 Tax=Desulfosarcina variabilis TaxID=2300 RepID=UPI003AFB0C89
MIATLALDRIETGHKRLVGGKALTLARLMREGIRVPDGLCVTTAVYEKFVRTTGLDTRIAMELGRLPLEKMRWEEIWDMALRIRNLFLNTAIPDPIMEKLLPVLADRVGPRPVVVRSSSPQEDRAGTSFAGLHDSYVNVKGLDDIMTHIRMVWASLWSDGALLYRRELGMDMQTSSMAVLVQVLVAGDRSGVAFSASPDGADHSIVESVYGLNQGLVDGTITPDRWTMDRRTGRVLSHSPANRESAVREVSGGVASVPLDPAEKTHPPLDEPALAEVFHLAATLEKIFGRPQDVEWTFQNGALFLLQSRPITTIREDAGGPAPWSVDDKRPWYLSLKRSFANLKILHQRIEGDLLPRMAAEADTLARCDPGSLSDTALAEAIDARMHIHQHWVDVYWRDFIPFAHGARLFGQVYNDMVKPEDPYAFTALLGETRMTGLDRNRDLQALARHIRSHPDLRDQLESGQSADLDPAFNARLDDFLTRYGDLTFKAVRFFKDREGLIRLLLEMAAQPQPPEAADRGNISDLTADFISRFPTDRQAFAREILEIGRSSYRLRDDDNIVLARIEAQLIKAVDEGKRRIAARNDMDTSALTPEQVLGILSDPQAPVQSIARQKTVDEPVEHQARPDLAPRAIATVDGDFSLRARQIIGQPAGQGLAVGSARVIAAADDLFQFKAGEILVCDAIDPNMTFVVPLAAAIVERRGGMLVHGAIIAREYGLPCVTGAADATNLIQTGDHLTVDGYLGIVTIDGMRTSDGNK